MKRYVRSNEDRIQKYEFPLTGFSFTFKDKCLFYKSSATNLTDKIIRVFINKVCDIKNINKEERDWFLYNRSTLDDFRQRISKSKLSKHDSGKITYYVLVTSNSSVVYPEKDFENEFIIF